MVENKLNKNRKKPHLIQMRNNLACDIQQERKRLCEQERLFVKQIGCHEPSIYTAVAAGIKPVILREVEQLGEVTEKVKKIIQGPSKDNNSLTSFVHSSRESFLFATHPSTPSGSAMGSRSSSIKSINSLSRPSSAAGCAKEEIESYRSRNSSFSSQLVNDFTFVISVTKLFGKMLKGAYMNIQTHRLMIKYVIKLFSETVRESDTLKINI
jgi:hypothetical protein